MIYKLETDYTNHILNEDSIIERTFYVYSLRDKMTKYHIFNKTVCFKINLQKRFKAKGLFSSNRAYESDFTE